MQPPLKRRKRSVDRAGRAQRGGILALAPALFLACHTQPDEENTADAGLNSPSTSAPAQSTAKPTQPSAQASSKPTPAASSVGSPALTSNTPSASSNPPAPSGSGAGIIPDPEDGGLPADVGAQPNGTSSTGDAGGTSNGDKVPAFIAQGDQGRLTISCDDGLSWTHNKSADDTFDCLTSDCDHSPWAAHGIVYGEGAFVATWGWGELGAIQRSTDGVTWQNVTEETAYAGIVFGAGRFVAVDYTPVWSEDGLDWQPSTTGPGLGGIVARAIGFSGYDGGRFIAAGEGDGPSALSWSADGEAWFEANAPDTCGANLAGIVGNDTASIAVSWSGQVCRSEDGGENWETTEEIGAVIANPLWTGSEFLAWGEGHRLRSVDGKIWESKPTSPTSIDMGNVARSESGTFVGVSRARLSAYANQAFFRSTDGVTWDVLDTSKFVGSHRILSLSFGYVDPGAGCP